MKRQDIIAKLMNEGLTQKTLVNMTDKQLGLLAERLLSEQYTTTSYGSTAGAPSVLNISRTDTAGITDAKAKKQRFQTYETDMKEEKLGGEEKKEKTEKEVVLQRINHKIETKMKKNECVKSEVELLKRMGEKIPEKVQKYCDKRKEEKKEKVLEPTEQYQYDSHKVKLPKVPVEPSQKPTTKPMPKAPVVGENKNPKKWVNKLVESKLVTSKKDIMSLIRKKLNEQETDIAEPDVQTSTLPDFLTYDAIVAAGGQPATKPGTKPTTKPGTRPTPKTPFQPGPGPKHNPKAAMEEEEKTKEKEKTKIKPKTPFNPEKGPKHNPKA